MQVNTHCNCLMITSIIKRKNELLQTLGGNYFFTKGQAGLDSFFP